MVRHLRAALLIGFLTQGGSVAAQTVDTVYKALSSGPLRQARLADLPDDTVLRAGAARITRQQIAADIAKAGASVRSELKRNQFFVLEQRATQLLLTAEAGDWSRHEKQAGLATDDARIRAYLRSIAAGAAVTDTETRSFYAANKDMVSGAAYDSVAAELKTYLLDQKRQEAVDAHINGLSKRTPVEVDAAWCKAQASTALDNPVDAARRSGKPALVDFGSTGCRPCEMLAPILDDLRKTYTGKCSVLLVQVREQQMLAARYGIETIPVQVFFDRDGNEVFRHVGFFPKDQILARLASIGVK
jgi:thiol-disulfide isomerase/thioredoxin